MTTTYFIAFIDGEDFEWCVFQSEDKDFACKVYDNLCCPPEYRMELRSTVEPLETYRTYDVIKGE